MSEVIVPHSKLIGFCQQKLEQVGVKSEEAELVAEVLVHADLRGVHSHGVLRTEHYVKRIKEGGLNVDSKLNVTNTGPCTAIVDGDNGFGHVIAKEAMEVAISLAEKNGVGMVTVVNSSHCGALSYFVNQAGQKGLIGMAMTHTDKIVVPYGSAESYFGTNPIAYGFPAKKNPPVILDMATSNVAFGKVLQAKEEGKNIPSDWGVDEKGRPVSEPDNVVSLLPLGGPKGYGLAMVVDMFSGILAGAAFGPHVKKMYGDYDKVRRLGHFVCAINPAMFTDPEQFKNDVDQMIEEIQKLEPAEGFSKVMVPGQPEQEREKDRLQNGIPITESVYNYLAEVERKRRNTNESLI